MNILKTHLIIIFLFSFQLVSSADLREKPTAGLRVKPTFNSCGIYLLSAEAKECKLFYKKADEKTWKLAFTPIYDKLNSEYRGSIVKLDENTLYNVKLELYKGEVVTNKYLTDFHTWTSNPTISKTLKISSFRNKYNESYDIENIKGDENGWIKIVGDLEVDALSTNRDYAIRITNSHHVILENITIKGGRHGILIPNSASQIRIINCDISKWGRIGVQNERGVYLDTNGDKINNDGGVKIVRAEDIVVERCYIHDARAKTNPWSGVIENGPFAGNSYKITHPEGANAIHVNQAVGGIVVRYNDLIGSESHRFNDPFETSSNGFIDGGLNKDADIYGNVLAFGQDDGIELDGGQCNVRFYNNRIEQTLCGISTAPNRKGPSYIFNNVVSNLGDGTNTQSASVKNGGGVTYSQGIQYFFNNTMIALNGIKGVGYGKDAQREVFIAQTRNNILMSKTKSLRKKSPKIGLSILDYHKSSWNDFDYDMISNLHNDGGKGMIIAKEGSELHGIFASPKFSDIEHGVYTLKGKDKGIDRGHKIDNFMESFKGSAPDLGAFEHGSSSLYPMRPINIEADKYHLKLEVGKVEKIKLKIGKVDKETTFRIGKSEDMDWLLVEYNTDIIKDNTEIILSIKAIKTTGRQMGMFIVRLENGFSVPISVEVIK